MSALTVTADSVVWVSGSAPVTKSAAVAITAGQCLYAASSSTVGLAQNDGTAAEVDAVGISLNAAAIGQPVAYAPHGAVINIGATTAKTTTYMVAAAAGGVAPQADLDSGKRICRLGYATDAVGAFVIDIKNHGVAV